MRKISITTAFKDSKPHYVILDGLRGVAAFMVLIYHVFEAFAMSPIDQRLNHGYLAVQFFFILSGFVIGYAYDDRFPKMTGKEFVKRRLIRLHPMVVIGVVLGVIAFFIQGGVQWDGTKVATSSVMLAMLLTLFLIPTVPGSRIEIRGNGELFPLNGPYWSLFLEYIGNLLYLLFIRKLSTKALKVWTVILGLGLAWYAIGNGSGYGHLGVGWTMANHYLWGGLLCMMFCFSVGLLISRVFKPIDIKGAFWWCSLGIIIIVAVPHIGGESALWLNGVYDALCVLLFFPLLVWLGASGKVTGKVSAKICKFIGDVSYPVYVIHYPSMYLFYAWVWKNGFTFQEVWYVGLGVIVGNILLAYLLLRVYDLPLRRWLAKKYLTHKS